MRFILTGRRDLDGDVQGVIMVCEDQLWNFIVLCKGEWTSANTLVACRELR